MSTGFTQRRLQRRTLIRVSVASTIGTTIEWYDFLLYGTAAALVFNQLFFPTFDPAVGVLLAFSTFAVGFIARPFGAALFGHFGDRHGRKVALVVTLVMMGLATAGIGLLPTYQSIGIAAPILLVILRLFQGLAVSGEFGGAILLAMEHAPEKWRAFFGNVAQLGVPIGLALSVLALNLVSLPISEEAFLAWGWRIPFLFSLVLALIGLYIRLRILESPDFVQVKERRTEARVPLVDVLRHHRRGLFLIIGAYPATGMTFYIVTTFALNYANTEVGVSQDVTLNMLLLSCFLMLVVIAGAAMLAIRLTPKLLYISGLAIMGITVFPLFWLLNTGQYWIMFVGLSLPILGFSICWGTLGAFFSQVFAARVRYTGLSLGYMLGTLVGSATAPAIATFLFNRTGSISWVPTYMIGMICVSAICALAMPRPYSASGYGAGEGGDMEPIQKEPAEGHSIGHM